MTKQGKFSIVEILQIGGSCEVRTLIFAILKHFANFVLGGGEGSKAGREESKIPYCLNGSLPDIKEKDTNSAIQGVKLCISD